MALAKVGLVKYCNARNLNSVKGGVKQDLPPQCHIVLMTKEGLKNTAEQKDVQEKAHFFFEPCSNNCSESNHWFQKIFLGFPY